MDKLNINQMPKAKSQKLELTLGWLYPELMSTYGDRGNIIVLQKIAEDNGISLKIERINQNSPATILGSCDLIFMGGAQDLQQEIVNQDLVKNKGEMLRQKINNGTPGLYICGAYQFLGNYYKDAYGTVIQGLGIFDMHTESVKGKDRLIGNIVVEAFGNWQLALSEDIYQAKSQTPKAKHYLVGFENHGGRTYLKDKKQTFARVIKGFGNNGEDATEGILYKNSIGTYLHGPILPSNPELAVHLLKKAYEHKYNEEVNINFDDQLSKKAKIMILKKLKIEY